MPALNAMPTQTTANTTPASAATASFAPRTNTTARLGEEGRTDRPVPELAGDGDEPGDRRKEHGTDPRAEHRALRGFLRQLADRARQPFDQPYRGASDSRRRAGGRRTVRVVRSLRSAEPIWSVMTVGPA
jgi:hypothetical protein